ncbi:hypothetical protein FA95DRAFT_956691 [Auriscalpium vulgare]|uniref:Uncharacterized protein n=1 Tax=Auriscalpium vulgare TaxID=40419 RepID=A0ACB8R7R6_9AGAM|nr:hypothetical protein FA95DRAFT_956691 [Auriscalpium vulgare]
MAVELEQAWQRLLARLPKLVVLIVFFVCTEPTTLFAFRPASSCVTTTATNRSSRPGKFNVEPQMLNSLLCGYSGRRRLCLADASCPKTRKGAHVPSLAERARPNTKVPRSASGHSRK